MAEVTRFLFLFKMHVVDDRKVQHVAFTITNRFVITCFSGEGKSLFSANNFRQDQRHDKLATGRLFFRIWKNDYNDTAD